MGLDKMNTISMVHVLRYPEFELNPDEPAYDPDIHLSLTEPDFVVLLDKFERVSKASKFDRPVALNGDGQLAYTGPFRVLSDEGYRVLSMILQRELVHKKGGNIPTKYVTYSGYRSKWIQDFNRCPRIRNHLSNITGDVNLLPDAFQLYYSQVNIGYADKRSVIQYHCDTVPYVLLLLASDTTQTIGGELQIIEHERKEAFRLIEQYKGQVPNEYIRRIDYGGINSCILMQGNRIAHRVTPIESCSEPRLTVVNSYITTNPFATDYARYSCYKNEPTAALEYAMHKAWRANRQMLELATDDRPYPTTNQVIQRLTMAIGELTQARDLISDLMSDQISYFDEKKQETYKYRSTDT